MFRHVHHAPAQVFGLALGAFLFLGAVVHARGAGEPAIPELSTPATNLLAAIAERYAAVTNLSCNVRRQMGGGGEEMVSRIVFARGGLLHAETLAPERHQAIVDGTFAWTKGEKDRKPRRVAFEDQSAAQKASVLCVPASPEETLRMLDSATGVDCPGPAAPHARQVVFRLLDAGTESPGRALVSLDDVGRVRAVDLFADADLRWRLASYAWDAPVEVIPGIWLFGRSTVETAVNGTPVSLTTRFENLRANQALAPGVFDADKAFGKPTAAKDKR